MEEKWSCFPCHGTVITSLGGRDLAPPDYVMLWSYRKTKPLLVKKKKSLVGQVMGLPMQQPLGVLLTLL